MLCMDEMPSSEFRKRYAGLREQTRVTVNGHLIGTWTPVQAIEVAERLVNERGDGFGRPIRSDVAQREKDKLLGRINRGR